MDDSAAETKVEWRPWGPDAFAAADSEQLPVFLSLSAPWCVWCHQMDREVFDEPRVAANVNDDFVPVRVDVDRHPQVRERYTMGGFPSNVFVTPDGEVITGASYLGVEGMRQALESARRTWDAKGREAGRIPRALRDAEPPGGELTGDVEAGMVSQLSAAFDEEFGGWGSGAKFPLPRTIEFALKRDPDRATRTLEAISTHLYDTYDGGFYRFAGERDWSDLHREKLLDANAGLVRAFANAYLATGEESYRDTAEGAIEYLTTELWTDDAFAGSQAGGDYFRLEATEREAADPPSVDSTIFADRNGLAADALLRFFAYTDHEAAGRYAERALDFVTDELVAEDGEVVHFTGGRETDSTVPSGLLVDHARLLGGLTTAAQVQGRDLETARAVADYALDALRDGPGPLRDGPTGGPGLLDRPLRPLDTNVEFADALVDLSYLTGEANYRERAREILEAFAGAASRMGPEAASYAAAVSRVVESPLVIEVGTGARSDLHRAALRMADHEKVVVPDADVEAGTAVASRGEERTAPAETPAELESRVQEIQ